MLHFFLLVLLVSWSETVEDEYTLSSAGLTTCTK